MAESTRTNGAARAQMLDLLKSYVAVVQERVPALEKTVSETRAAVQSEVSKALTRAAKTDVATKAAARAKTLRRDLRAWITRSRDGIFDTLGIATKSELGALSRKVNKLAKTVSSSAE